MNGIKCPNCDLVNMVNASVCHRCQSSLENLPQTAQVSVPIEETFQAQAFATSNQADFSMDNELGSKTYFWFRIYLGAMAALYLAVIVFGSIAAYFSQYETNSQEAQELFITGIIYAVIGVPFFLAFAIGLFIPRKPWGWIAGMVYICIGMTSCCFLPAVIPLLIFWLKPETQAYFGRN